MNPSLLVAAALLCQTGAAPHYSAELIFPLDDQHNHAPGIVECPNGDLLASWPKRPGVPLMRPRLRIFAASNYT